MALIYNPPSSEEEALVNEWAAISADGPIPNVRIITAEEADSPSMEDILASIRRILSDDEKDAAMDWDENSFWAVYRQGMSRPDLYTSEEQARAKLTEMAAKHAGVDIFLLRVVPVLTAQIPLNLVTREISDHV